MATLSGVSILSASKRLYKEPLVHFLAAGLALFLLFELFAPDDATKVDPKTVVVDREALLTFIQFRSKAFERGTFEARLDALPDDELERLIDDYVREEVLHREALALGLDGNDYIIKRRLIQKLEFITQGFAEAAAQMDEAAVETYFETNKDDYYVAPSVTFTHVFFDAERHGPDQAQAWAEAKLMELNGARVPFADAPKHGDRFLYHLNYVERTPDYVASHFGSPMAEAIFDLERTEGEWHGPYESPYGFHLVMTTKMEAGRYPALEEIYERVADDARRADMRRKTEEVIRQIVDSYDVEITYRRAPGARVAQSER